MSDTESQAFLDAKSWTSGEFFNLALHKELSNLTWLKTESCRCSPVATCSLLAFSSAAFSAAERLRIKPKIKMEFPPKHSVDPRATCCQVTVHPGRCGLPPSCRRMGGVCEALLRHQRPASAFVTAPLPLASAKNITQTRPAGPPPMAAWRGTASQRSPPPGHSTTPSPHPPAVAPQGSSPTAIRALR